MSYQVIARKYRPQIFDEVVGQRLITDTLKNALQHNRVAHGYIFSGARGVGKTTTARILAKALNCFQGITVTPCGECPSCREIAAGNSVDVLEIDAASNRGIDEIRELRETVRYLPARDRYRAFIIDEAHMLTTEAFNALLKTLEEPPPRSLFILATTEPHKLPSTIQSRCQHFAFRLLDYAEIYARLQAVAAAEKIEAEEGAFSALAQAAEGSLRDALSLLDQVIASCGERLDEAQVRRILGVVPTQLLCEMVEAIHAGGAQRVLDLVGQLAAEGYELPHFCGEFTRMVRNLMVAKSCGAESSLLQVPNDERQKLAELAALFSEEDLTRFFQVLVRTEGEMRYSLQPRFHLELGLMKLVHARKLASLESLLAELKSGAGVKAAGAPAQAPAAGPATTGPVKTREAAPPGDAARPAEQPSVAPAPRSEPPGAVAPAVTPALAAAAGAEDSRLDAIKALLFNQSKKFLSSCLEHSSACRFENGKVDFRYPKNESWAADFVRSREQLEALRAACAQVLGQPVKICVTLDEESETRAAPPSARERAERDGGVEAFRKRFDGALVDVKDLSRE
jgi:DNA polymerase-3 subunit gamma/tau